MLEELKSEDIVNKVGGRFKLVALMQKRLQELLEGLRALANEAEGFAARCGASPHRA